MRLTSSYRDLIDDSRLALIELASCLCWSRSRVHADRDPWVVFALPWALCSSDCASFRADEFSLKIWSSFCLREPGGGSSTEILPSCQIRRNKDLLQLHSLKKVCNKGWKGCRKNCSYLILDTCPRPQEFVGQSRKHFKQKNYDLINARWMYILSIAWKDYELPKVTLQQKALCGGSQLPYQHFGGADWCAAFCETKEYQFVFASGDVHALKRWNELHHLLQLKACHAPTRTQVPSSWSFKVRLQSKRR